MGHALLPETGVQRQYMGHQGVRVLTYADVCCRMLPYADVC